MPHNKLHNTLLKRNLPAQTIQSIEETVRENKAHQRAAVLSRARQREQWQPMLHDLRAERQTLRVSIRYNKAQVLNGSTAKAQALQAYDIVLAKLQEKLTAIKKSKQTPGQAAKARNIPNGGTHWVDWVPAHIQERVILLFDAIPRVPHSKTFVPFKRSAKLATAQVTRLRARTLVELATAQRMLAAAPQSEKYIQRVSKIRHALDQIDRLKPQDPVPRTWHGLKTEQI
jgi:hypothetical protein